MRRTPLRFRTDSAMTQTCAEAPECASRTHCSAAPSPPAAAVFDFRAHLYHSVPHGNALFRLQTPRQRPGGPKAISYQSIFAAISIYFVMRYITETKRRALEQM